jgi:hypothetical protein
MGNTNNNAQNLEEKADFCTLNEELADIVLCEFPGLIFPDKQYIIDRDSDGTVYRFLDLDYKKLKQFLKPYKNIYEYEITRKGHNPEINKAGRRFMYN